MRHLLVFIPLFIVLILLAGSAQAATNVTLVSPANGNVSTTPTSVNYTFNCSASDSVQLANISLWINSTGIWEQNQTENKTGIWNFSVFNLTLGPGYYIWNCRVGDNSSNYNFSSQNWTIQITASDLTPPNLWFAPPVLGNQSGTPNNWIYVNVSANESLNASILNWYNGTWQNLSMAVNGNGSWINMTGLSDRSYYFRVYGNDTAGNWNVTEDRSITVDTIYPAINITSPQNGSVYSNTTLYLNFTYSETNLHSCWYQYNGTNATLGNCTGANFTALDHQQSELRVWINDTAGNLNSSAVVFSVCTVSWSCTSWSACSGGVQSRTCTDLYTCGNDTGRPSIYNLCETPGGGGGGGGASFDITPQVSKKWETIAPGEEVSMDIQTPGLELSQVKILVTSELRNVSMAIAKIDSVPQGVSGVSGKVYQYVNVSASGLRNLKSAGIGFKVSKSWLEKNNINRSRVYLNRYRPSLSTEGLGEQAAGWVRLNTSYQGEDNSSVFYYSFTPGFSYFAITGETVSIQPPAQPGMQSQQNKTITCNNNGICDPGENQSGCLDCKPLERECDKGEFRCNGKILQVCGNDGQWMFMEECANGCLDARCKEGVMGIPGLMAAIIIVISGIIAYILGITVWRRRISPYRYFRI